MDSCIKDNSPKARRDIKELAKQIGWQGDFALLQQALTHPTFFEGIKAEGNIDNQRLEFLGDAVLGILVGEELYRRYPHANEGFLSKTRSSMVCEGALADIARTFDLSDYLLMGKGSLKKGEQHRDSIMSDAFEAMIGAMYLQMGMEVVRRFVELLFTTAFENVSADKYEDFKGLMQQLVQSIGEEHLHYRLLRTEGPDHDRTYTIALYYHGMKLGEASGSSKKEAEQGAASMAWHSKEDWLNKV
jgi:ribonuclease-3